MTEVNCIQYFVRNRVSQQTVCDWVTLGHKYFEMDVMDMSSYPLTMESFPRWRYYYEYQHAYHVLEQIYDTDYFEILFRCVVLYLNPSYFDTLTL